MKINSSTVAAAQEYVPSFLKENLDAGFLFHDLTHTTDVVKAAGKIGSKMEVSEHDRNILLVAAWFHDLGYTRTIDHHEEESASLAEEFLRLRGVDDADIATVRSCILATRYPQRPETTLEMILGDADLLHLSGKKYVEKSALLRQEWAITRKQNYTDAEWTDLSIQFMKGHHYHSTYGKEIAEKRKARNAEHLVALKKNAEQTGFPEPESGEILSRISHAFTFP